jgi:signal transduction histidine kinase
MTHTSQAQPQASGEPATRAARQSVVLANLVLRVEDNGTGICAARLEKNECFGLASMQERAPEIGGRFKIQTAAGRGTSITVTVPISSIRLTYERAGRTPRHRGRARRRGRERFPNFGV